MAKTSNVMERIQEYQELLKDLERKESVAEGSLNSAKETLKELTGTSNITKARGVLEKLENELAERNTELDALEEELEVLVDGLPEALRG